MNTPQLSVPFYFKTDENMPWPTDKLFYLLTRDGLFICRNHEWFQSCAPALSGPAELQPQKPFCNHNYPRIPRVLLEKAIGFFRRIYDEHHWESALILVWNRTTRQLELVCPEQKASWGAVKYDIPILPPHLAAIGDLHSHGSMAPFASYTDEEDEMNRPGVHIVVGDLDRKQPSFYCALVADKQRFKVEDIAALAEPWEKDDPNFPAEWLTKVKEKTWGYSSGSSYMGGYSDHIGMSDYHDYDYYHRADKSDKQIMKEILAKFMKSETRPNEFEVRQSLFRNTKHVPYLACEKKAAAFMKAWDKVKGVNSEKAA